jgi:hypothetical protein
LRYDGAMGQIRIAYRCQRRQDGTWSPAFELTLIEDGQIRILPIMSAADPRLTFVAKDEAEAASDAMAREWCAKNYPGWPVQPL